MQLSSFSLWHRDGQLPGDHTRLWRTNPNDHIQKFLAPLINKAISSMVIGCYLCLIDRLQQGQHPSCVNGGIIRTQE